MRNLEEFINKTFFNLKIKQFLIRKILYINIGKNKGISMGIEKAGLQLGKEIIAWARNGKSVLATRPIKVNIAELKLAHQLDTDIVELSSKKGFCHEYWSKWGNKRNLKLILEDGERVSLNTPTQVRYHASLNSFNHMLNNTGRIDLNRKLKAPSYYEPYPPTVKDTITVTDIAFKRLAPIAEDLTVYRCIPKRPSFLQGHHELFQKSISVKPGETTVMREYAYCTPDTSYAKAFLGDECGILYEISLPKGARISQGTAGYRCSYGDYVLPRYSRFKCISNEILEDGSHKIKLEYILPDESWRKI